jgi:dTDP-4-dehydrorhamnose 3,5-epimerase
MIFKKLSIPGAFIIETTPFEDNRGLFERIFCGQEFQRAGLSNHIVQINRSVTRRKGTIRGMHYQLPPHAEVKTVQCLQGAVYDVLVDLRRDSDTFLQWHSEILSSRNRKIIHIPEGVAHGFQTLEDDSQLLYFHSEFYYPDCERGVRYDDPQLGILWPEAVTDISEKDRTYSFLDTCFTGV